MSRESALQKGLSGFISESQLSNLILASCKQEELLYAREPRFTKAQLSTLQRRVSYISKAIAGQGDPYLAAKEVANVSWINNWEPIKFKAIPTMPIVSKIKSGIVTTLSKDKKVSPNDHAYLLDRWQFTIVEKIFQKCGIRQRDNTRYTDLAAQYQSSTDAVVLLAESVPWYPKGYKEWSEDSSLAWRWSSGGSCQLGDSCWHVKVISKDGCPSSLYVEMNELDSGGNVVDYTNATVSGIGAGQTAILELSTYNSNSSTGQLTKISCY